MNSEPRSNRIHIALFGRCNSGKSTLLNAMAGEEVSIVSQQAGTTTDVVRKNIELPELGACVLLDTAGLDDNSLLAQQRIAQTRKELEKAEIGILVIDGTQTDLSIEKELEKIPNPTVREHARDYLTKIEKGERDFRF